MLGGWASVEIQLNSVADRSGLLEAEALGLRNPIQWQIRKPHQGLGGEIDGLTTSKDRRDDAGSQESEGKLPADLAGGNPIAGGDVVDRCDGAGLQVLKPATGSGDGADQMWIG